MRSGRPRTVWMPGIALIIVNPVARPSSIAASQAFSPAAPLSMREL